MDPNKPFDISNGETIITSTQSTIAVIAIVITMVSVSLCVYRTRMTEETKVFLTSITITLAGTLTLASIILANINKIPEKEEFISWANDRYGVNVTDMRYRTWLTSTPFSEKDKIFNNQGDIIKPKIIDKKVILVDDEGKQLPITNTESKEHDNVK